MDMTFYFQFTHPNIKNKYLNIIVTTYQTV